LAGQKTTKNLKVHLQSAPPAVENEQNFWDICLVVVAVSGVARDLTHTLRTEGSVDWSGEGELVLLARQHREDW